VKDRRPLALVIVCLLACLAAAPCAAAKGKSKAKKPAADLLATSVSKPPARLGRGALLPASVTVANRGKAGAARGLVRLYLSPNRKLDKRDALLGGAGESAPLRAGRSAKLTVRGVVPETAALAPLYVLACADDAKGIKESNERNNCVASKARVAVAPRGATPVAPTSRALIEQAVAARKLTPEQALVYSVYDRYGDPRLPAAYQGAPDPDADEHLMSRVRRSYPTLSAAAKKLIKPFLQRPSYPGSWWDQRYGAGGAKTARAGALRCGKGLDSWSYVDAQKVPVRILYQDRYATADKANAATLARIFDTAIYPQLTALMGKKPLPDSSDSLGNSIGICDGGNTSLDVSLVDFTNGADGQTTASSCDGAPAEIDLNRGNPAELGANATHEFMHAIQYAFDAVDSCEKTRWWMDATAEWAIDFIDPADNTEQRHQAKFYERPDLPLDEDPSPADPRRYGANMYPFFLARTGSPATIAATWAAIEKTTTLKAIDGAVGGFAASWPAYARFAVNEPIDPLEKGFDALRTDKQTQPVRTTAEDGVTLGTTAIDLSIPAAGDIERRPPVTVKRLSARYFRFDTRGDQNIRSLAVDVPPPSEAAVKVELLGKLNGTWRRVGGSLVNRLLCRTVQAEAFEQLMLIYANTSTETDWTATREEQPRVISSNIGCRFAGSGGFEASTALGAGIADFTTDQQASGNFTLEYDPTAQVDNDGSVRFVGTSGSASGRYTETVKHNILSIPECVATANGAERIGPGGKAYVVLDVNMFGTARQRRQIGGSGSFTDNYPLSKDCSLEQKTPDPRTGLPSFFDPFGDRFEPDGKFAGRWDAPNMPAGQFIRSTWSLTPS
jgi:CARDB